MLETLECWRRRKKAATCFVSAPEMCRPNPQQKTGAHYCMKLEGLGSLAVFINYKKSYV